MYTIPKSKYARRSMLVNTNRARLIQASNPRLHRERVLAELKSLGLSRSGLASMESRYLPLIIHPDEHIGGIVFGYSKDGFAILVATDRRIIFLDKKPFFVNEDEITYGVVSGVKFSRASFGSIVTLHTRVRDYAINTLNEKCANDFVEYIESRCLENNYMEKQVHDQLT